MTACEQTVGRQDRPLKATETTEMQNMPRPNNVLWIMFSEALVAAIDLAPTFIEYFGCTGSPAQAEPADRTMPAVHGV
jgi:hypothetical protein